MQYSFTLPRDYDMALVRERVVGRGAGADSREHLVFQAYLIAEAGVRGGRENIFAPFYLWRSEQGTTDFLCGPVFEEMTTDFGWPVVRTWIPLCFGYGSGNAAPNEATRQIVRVPPHTNLASLHQAERDAQAEALTVPQIHSRLVGLDIRIWELVCFTLWDGEESAETETAEIQAFPESYAEYDPVELIRYEVLSLTSGLR